MSEYQETSMAHQLLRKQAKVKKIGNDTGANVTAANNEVLRQIGQVSKVNNGNPISGEGVTKSGPED